MAPFPPSNRPARSTNWSWRTCGSWGCPPAGPCSDEVFLRRAFLDVTGTLPSPEEARAFLADKNPAKRKELIDSLLGREEFVAFWALKWSDLLRIKGENPVNLWPKGAEAYYQWVYESVAREQALRPDRARVADGHGEQFPQWAVELLPRGAEPRAADLWRVGRAGLPGGQAVVRPLPWASRGSLGPGRQPGHGRVLRPDPTQGDRRMEGADRLSRPRRGACAIRDGRAGPAAAAGRRADGDPAGRRPPRGVRPMADRAENPGSARNIVNRIWYWLLGAASSTSRTTCGRRTRPRTPRCWTTWPRNWLRRSTT